MACEEVEKAVPWWGSLREEPLVLSKDHGGSLEGLLEEHWRGSFLQMDHRGHPASLLEAGTGRSGGLSSPKGSLLATLDAYEWSSGEALGSCRGTWRAAI